MKKKSRMNNVKNWTIFLFLLLLPTFKLAMANLKVRTFLWLFRMVSGDSFPGSKIKEKTFKKRSHSITLDSIQRPSVLCSPTFPASQWGNRDPERSPSWVVAVRKRNQISPFPKIQNSFSLSAGEHRRTHANRIGKNRL